jgi:2-oxoglutarate ferredoxin oxidoreductase subunit alpha
MAEVPLVIVDVQRMGPATGGATTGAQGDIQFLRWGTSGGFPIIAFTPSNIYDCYLLTQRAFDLAERFRVPVFLACDKQIVLNRTTVERSAFEDINVRKRNIAPAREDFVPYRFAKPAEVPPMSPFGGPHLVRITTSSHNEYGYLTKKNEDMDLINRHLKAKITAHRDEIAEVKTDLQDGADTLIISYGITAQSVREAIQLLRGEGSKISSLVVLSLWPVPERQVLRAMKGMKRIIVAELNQGQYRREIERLASDAQEIIGVNRIDGGMLSPREILEGGGL